jgi:hypothetical protein
VERKDEAAEQAQQNDVIKKRLHVRDNCSESEASISSEAPAAWDPGRQSLGRTILDGLRLNHSKPCGCLLQVLRWKTWVRF